MAPQLREANAKSGGPLSGSFQRGGLSGGGMGGGGMGGGGMTGGMQTGGMQTGGGGPFSQNRGGFGATQTGLQPPLAS